MTQVFERSSGELGYPGGGKRALRLLSGLLCAITVVGSIWVLVDDLHKPAAVVVLIVFEPPVAYLAWIFLRGVLDRRSSLLLDDVGLSILSGGTIHRSIPWTEVRALHHVGRTVDQHLRLRAGPKDWTVRVYYDVEDGAAVLEEIVSRVHGARDAYSLPFAARRPALLRALLWPLLVAVPCFAVGVVALANGVVTPFIVLGLMGSFLLVGKFIIHRRQPSEISVSEAGLTVGTAAGGVQRVCWSEVTGLRLGFSEKQPYPPVLFVEEKGVPPLAIEVGWVDAIRLYGLVQRAWRTFSKGPGSL